jgi:hypothetical protein
MSTKESGLITCLGLEGENIYDKICVIGGRDGFSGSSAPGANEIFAINNASGKMVN